MVTFSIQNVKGHCHCDIIIFCTNTFLAIIQCYNSGGDGDHIAHLVDTELVTLIFDVHLETVQIVWIFCAAGLRKCEAFTFRIESNIHM